MKVRFGFTCRGQTDLALDDFPRLVDDLERLGFDSLWLPERMLNGPFDPLVGLAHAAARTDTSETRRLRGRAGAQPDAAGPGARQSGPA